MKIINSRFLGLGVFLLLAPLLCAQSNYRPGFIITLQKDTVYGEIDFRTDEMNAGRCVFQSKVDAKVETYYPFDIQGYRFTDDGRFYVSKSIELQYNGPSKAVFLECLLQGMKSLYYYEAEGRVPIYFVENGDVLIKVDAPILAEAVTDFQFKDDKDRYMPILHYAFSDCPRLSSRIDRTRFNRKALIGLAKEYHYAMCTNHEDCIEFEAKEAKRSVQLCFTPYVGIVQYTMSSGSSADFYRKPDLSWLVGVNLAASIKRWVSSISGCVDLSFSRLSTTGIGDAAYIIKYTGIMLSGKLGVRYTYPKGVIRPFIEFGADFNSLLLSEVEVDDQSEKWLDNILAGYYVNAGLNFKLSRKKDQMFCVRFQFQDVRDTLLKNRFANAWSGVIGYTF